MVSKAKEIDGFDKDTIYQDLRKENRNDVRLIYIIMDLIFSPAVMDIVKELEEDFKDNGNRHYPRLLLLGIVLYCFKQKDYKYEDIVLACKSNLFLRIFTRGAEPCESTFRNFLNTPKPDSFRKIFLYTLLRFNEYDLLKFLHYFVDGTDAIIRGSKFYKIYQIELKAMKFMAEHNLLHNSKEKQMKRSINKLNKLKKQNTDDEEMQKLIGIIIPRIQIYNHRLYKRIDEFEQAIENSNKDFVCITYPNAPLIPTKKGKWDFAKNLQMAVTDNNVIIGSIFINEPDDSKALEKLLPELKKNFEMLVELQKKYGTRRNYTELENLLKQAMIICDSGYDSEANVVFLYKNEIKSLIMPKITSRYINNQMRTYDKDLEKFSGEITITDENSLEKTHKVDMPRIWNGYLCKNNRPVMLYAESNIKEEQEKDLPEIATKKIYKYKSEDCSGCPYQDICKHKSFIEKIKPYSFESMNKFTQKFYIDLYMKRFQKSESVYGYFKGKNGVLHLLGNNDIAISNEMNLLSTLYNTIHLVELKGTFC